jgi:hypothetical protein
MNANEKILCQFGRLSQMLKKTYGRNCASGFISMNRGKNGNPDRLRIGWPAESEARQRIALTIYCERTEIFGLNTRKRAQGFEKTRQ